MENSDYSAFVPVVNRPDLLDQLVESARDLWLGLCVIDNSPDRWVGQDRYPPVRVFTPPVPMSFSQSMNWAMEETLRNARPFCITMHSDAIIPEGAANKLLDYARNLHTTHPKWGVIYTHYDVLAVYNPQAYLAIGGYDTVFPAYFSDNDWYRRLDLAGWERINSGIQVEHVGSQTINSSSYLQYLNGITFPLYREYYRQKWNGGPGEEKFITPFGVTAFS